MKKGLLKKMAIWLTAAAMLMGTVSVYADPSESLSSDPETTEDSRLGDDIQSGDDFSSEDSVMEDAREDASEKEACDLPENAVDELSQLDADVVEEELNQAYTYQIPGATVVDKKSYTRLNGETRYYTALNTAEVIKKIRGISRFNAIVVCDGYGFPDSLSGSYLAYLNQAPIIYVDKTMPNPFVIQYCIDNIAANGTVYVMGLGIDESFDAQLMERGISVVRLGGPTRYETNLEALNMTGTPGNKLIVSFGGNFPDAMCASTTGIPIMLVDGNKLHADQKEFLASFNGNLQMWITGGEAVVPPALYNELRAYASSMKRVYGDTRYDTAIAIANEFGRSSSNGELVMSEGENYVDGLAASQLAVALNVPMILGHDRTIDQLRKYVQDNHISHIYLAEKWAALSDDSMVYILSDKPPIVNGKVYSISTALNTNLVIDIPSGNYAEGIKVQLYNSNDTDAQKFQFQKQSDGTYVIMNAKTGLCLTAKAYGGSSWGASPGTSVIQYNEIESEMYKKYQKWQAIPVNGGYYFRNPATGLNMEVVNSSANSGNNLWVNTPRSTNAQIFYVNLTQASCYLRWHGYATNSAGRQTWLEGTYWDDPKVSDADFLAAAIYTESGNQGYAGMMLTGYSMLNRSSIADLRFAIYQYGQYEICRDGALTKLLTAMATNNTGAYSQLATARQAANACIQGQSFTLSEGGVMYYPGGSRSLPAGTVLTKNDCRYYDGFMTPAAMSKHGFTTTNKHCCHYKGHVYYNTAEVWG